MSVHQASNQPAHELSIHPEMQRKAFQSAASLVKRQHSQFNNSCTTESQKGYFRNLHIYTNRLIM